MQDEKIMREKRLAEKSQRAGQMQLSNVSKEIHVAHYDSPVGELLLAEQNDCLIGLWMKGQKYEQSTLFGAEVLRSTSLKSLRTNRPTNPQKDSLTNIAANIQTNPPASAPTIQELETPMLTRTKRWLDQYFAGERSAIAELDLAPSGSEFRRKVWKLLCEIPYGEVTTYGALAEKLAIQLGKSGMSAQAVGGAVGHNPISIIIPCHRVVGTTGSLTGYAGGIQRKVQLLEHEGVDMTHLFAPNQGTAL